jgi:hypothetical protein
MYDLPDLYDELKLQDNQFSLVILFQFSSAIFTALLTSAANFSEPSLLQLK